MTSLADFLSKGPFKGYTCSEEAKELAAVVGANEVRYVPLKDPRSRLGKSSCTKNNRRDPACK